MLYTVKEKTQLRLPNPCIPSGLYLHTSSLSQLVAPLGSQPMIPLPPGTLTVEQIYQDRDQFAKLVREVAAPDVGRMGIEIDLKRKWFLETAYQLNRKLNLAMTQVYAVATSGMFSI